MCLAFINLTRGSLIQIMIHSSWAYRFEMYKYMYTVFVTERYPYVHRTKYTVVCINLVVNLYIFFSYGKSTYNTLVVSEQTRNILYFCLNLYNMFMKITMKNALGYYYGLE